MPASPLTRDRLRALAEARPERGRVVSVFLNLDPAEFSTQPARATAINSLLNDVERRVAEVAEQLDHDEAQSLKGDAELVREALNDHDAVEGGAQGVAVFACQEVDLLEIVRLPYPVDSRVEIDTTAYVEPLVATGAQERWCVLLANRRNARLFIGTADALEETDRIEDQVHQQHSAGGWSQARFERSVQEDVDNHLRNAADVAFMAFKRRPWDAMLIGAPDEIAGDVENALHSYLRERVKGRLHIDVNDSSLDDVRAAAREGIDQHLRDRERDVLDRVAEHVGRGERGAAGLADVLDALNMARVEILVVLDGHHAPGGRDPNTLMLAAQADDGMEPVDNVVEEAMQKAIETNADVIVVRHHREDIEAHGGVAALLRY